MHFDILCHIGQSCDIDTRFALSKATGIDIKWFTKKITTALMEITWKQRMDRQNWKGHVCTITLSEKMTLAVNFGNPNFVFVMQRRLGSLSWFTLSSVRVTPSSAGTFWSS